MSDWSILCDAIIDDLKNNVNQLVSVEEASTHRYSPWSPEELTADGKPHLAVWPVGENAETRESLANQSDQLNQVYVILYWESSGTEGVRLVSDEAGAAALLDLQNAVRSRISRVPFEQLAGANRVKYSSTGFPEQVSRVRGFEIRLSVWRFQEMATS